MTIKPRRQVDNFLCIGKHPVRPPRVVTRKRCPTNVWPVRHVYFSYLAKIDRTPGANPTIFEFTATTPAL
jgi:hypothetical protein